MGKIFGIFIQDIKTFYRNIVAFIIIIGITILPALYSWFNIASNWDPYSSTSGLKFAVCNLDEGYTYKQITIDAGKQLTDALKANPKMGWEFVDEKQAIDGTESGEYYAAIVIPKDFSKNLCSITTGDFVKSKLQYYVNEKKNAVAPKITNSGMTAVENEMKSTYVNTVTNVLATMLNITATEITGKKDGVIDSVKESLNDLVEDLDTASGLTKSFVSTLELLKEIVQSNKEFLPSIKEAAEKTEGFNKDVKSMISAAKRASEKTTDALGKIIDSVNAMQDNVGGRVEQLFADAESDTSSFADKLIELTELNRKIISVNDRILEIAFNINGVFGIDMTPLIEKINTFNQHQQEMIDTLYGAADRIKKTGELSKDIRKEIKSFTKTLKTEITAVVNAYAALKAPIEKLTDDMYGVLETGSAFMNSAVDNIPNFEKSLDNASGTIDNTITTFKTVQKSIDNAKQKLKNMIEKADGFKGRDDLTDVVMSIIDDPGALAEFFSGPVETETHRIHPIDNYGSAMSPFYTSLGIWVGGIVLIAVIKVELSEKQMKKLKNPGKTQQYLGRYIIFFVLSLMQALIISLGDLYFLKIQCNSPGLFILGCLISAFVYSMIIYTLTISFNVIGKAMAVIILVLQVAGSGGTFPLEVLPAPYQAIAKFLPFRYGNDILREAIAGPDVGVYWKNVLILLAYIPFALLLGLVLRRPCIRLMHFIDKRMHQSDIVV